MYVRGRVNRASEQAQLALVAVLGPLQWVVACLSGPAKSIEMRTARGGILMLMPPAGPSHSAPQIPGMEYLGRVQVTDSMYLL